MGFCIKKDFRFLWSLSSVRDGARTKGPRISLIHSTTSIYITLRKINCKPVKCVFSLVQDSCIFNWSALCRRIPTRLHIGVMWLIYCNSCNCVSFACKGVYPSSVRGSKRDFLCWNMTSSKSCYEVCEWVVDSEFFCASKLHFEQFLTECFK